MAEPALPLISFKDRLSGSILTRVNAAVITSLEANKGQETGGRRGWEQNIVARHLKKFVTLWLDKDQPSPWELAMNFNAADPEMIILTALPAEDRSELLNLLQDNAEKVLGPNLGEELEKVCYMHGSFNPDLLNLNVFAVAGEMINALRQENLLPKAPNPANELDAKIGHGLTELLKLVLPWKGVTPISTEQAAQKLKERDEPIGKILESLVVRIRGEIDSDTEAVIANLPLMERIMAKARLSGEAVEEIDFKSLEAVVEAFIPKATVPGLEFNVAFHEAEKGIGIRMVLGQSREKETGLPWNRKTEEEFLGITVDFVLASSGRRLITIGEVNYDDSSIPQAWKTAAAAISAVAKGPSLNFGVLKQVVMDKIGKPQKSLEEFFGTTFKKRGIRFGVLQCEVVDKKRLILKVGE